MTEHPSLKLAKDKRIKLFQISSGEFAAYGFKQASLNRIISEVKMSKSSFYHYFQNKEDLFRVTLENVLSPVLLVHHSIDLEAMAVETFWPTLIAKVGEAMAIVTASPETVLAGKMFYRCYDDPDGHEVAQEILGEFKDWTTKLIQRGQALELIRTDIPESLLISVLMSMGMTMDRWMMENWDQLDDGERMQLGQAGFGLFLRLVKPD